MPLSPEERAAILCGPVSSLVVLRGTSNCAVTSARLPDAGLPEERREVHATFAVVSRGVESVFWQFPPWPDELCVLARVCRGLCLESLEEGASTTAGRRGIEGSKGGPPPSQDDCRHGNARRVVHPCGLLLAGSCGRGRCGRMRAMPAGPMRGRGRGCGGGGRRGDAGGGGAAAGRAGRHAPAGAAGAEVHAGGGGRSHSGRAARGPRMRRGGAARAGRPGASAGGAGPHWRHAVGAGGGVGRGRGPCGGGGGRADGRGVPDPCGSRACVECAPPEAVETPMRHVHNVAPAYSRPGPVAVATVNERSVQRFRFVR